MANPFKNKTVKIKLITIATLTVFILLMMLFADHPQAVERYYSQGLYPVICHVFHAIFNLLPFSMGDIIYIAVIIWLLYLFVKMIRTLFKRRWGRAGILILSIIIGIQVTVASFYVLWGLNYYRPEAVERLNLADTAYTLNDLKAVTSRLIDSANACRERVSDTDLGRSNSDIYQTAIVAVNHLADSSSAFKTISPGIKSSLLTPLINYLGTSGYYNPFTSESQMNDEMPVFVRPFVACHELSHQMGFAPEDEANFVGFLTAMKSKDKFFRYSAYYAGVQEFMFALRMQDSTARNELKKHISPQVLADFKAERKYWLGYQGKLETISGVFYDNFLKANNQPQGLQTYNRMILLVLAYRKKHQL